MENKSKNFKEVLVWQKAHALVIEIYTMAKQFPKEEVFGLTIQLKRAAVSIPANIAEGFSRQGFKDKLRFYNISAGSLSEVQYYLILAKDLGYAETSELFLKTEEIGRILNSYCKSLQSKLA